jgi:hypothetical protein
VASTSVGGPWAPTSAIGVAVLSAKMMLMAIAAILRITYPPYLAYVVGLNLTAKVLR